MLHYYCMSYLLSPVRRPWPGLGIPYQMFANPCGPDGQTASYSPLDRFECSYEAVIK